MSNLAKISRSIGKPNIFISAMKNRNIELFNFCLDLGGGDIGKGVLIYENKAKEVKKKIDVIYYSLIKNRELSKFIRETDLDYSPTVFNHFLAGVGIAYKNTMRYDSYLKCINIINEWDKYNERVKVSK